MTQQPAASNSDTSASGGGSSTAGNPAVREHAPSNEWVREHYPRIHRAAWMMTGDAWEAEDLAQQTFVVALERWHRFEGRAAESTWLYGILVKLRQRRFRTLARMQRRLREYVDRRGDRESEDPQHVLSQQQWRESIWSDVARLPPAQRDAVTLRYAEGMSYEEVAKIVGCVPGTAKSRVHHGVKRLREMSSDLSQLQTPRSLSIQASAR